MAGGESRGTGGGGAGGTGGAGGAAGGLRLVRWNLSSGSNAQSRSAVVLQSGDHQWEGRAEATGPVAALYRAVDAAIGDVLGGHPRLLSYDVHAVSETPDSQAVVTLSIAAPEGAGGGRAGGSYPGEASDENVIAASVMAYVNALNALLGDEVWAGATDAAGNRRVAETDAAAALRKARNVALDEDEAERSATNWFDR